MWGTPKVSRMIVTDAAKSGSSAANEPPNSAASSSDVHKDW